MSTDQHGCFDMVFRAFATCAFAAWGFSAIVTVILTITGVIDSYVAAVAIIGGVVIPIFGAGGQPHLFERAMVACVTAPFAPALITTFSDPLHGAHATALAAAAAAGASVFLASFVVVVAAAR